MLEFLLIGLLLLQFPVGSSIEMIGQTVTDVTQIQIGDEYLNGFNMTVLSANDTASLNENITVVMSTFLSPPPLGSRVNVTGTWDETAQVFRATSVQIVNQSDWFGLIKEAIALVASVMSLIANAIAGLVAMGTGYSVNPLIITAILEALFVLSLIKYYKTIGLVLVLVIVFLAVSGGLQFLRVFAL